MVSVLRSIAGPGGIAGACAQKAFYYPLLFSKKENTIAVGFPLRGPPAKQQGPGSQRQPRPSLAYGDQRARGEKGQRCFAEQSYICVAFGSPRRVDVSRIQLSEPRFEPWVRLGLGADVPSCLCGDSWGLSPEDIFQ